MPYIQKEVRSVLNNRSLEGLNPLNAGELNYCVTVLVKNFLKYKGKPRYDDYNAAIGALESAKLELYRRQVSPYEDEKITANGDVY